MAVVRTDLVISAPAALAWDMLAAVGEAHRAFAPVLSACRMEGEAVRVVTFTNGPVVKEEIIAVDQGARRLSYRVIEGGFAHHNAAFEIIPVDDATCRFVWTCDVLPHEAAARVRPLMDSGAQAFAANCRARVRSAASAVCP